MNLLILGATGRTGKAVLQQAKAAGHTVTSYGRREAAGADTALTGNFEDPAFAAAVRAADAVISCLASSNTDPVCSQAAKAVHAAEPTARYLTVAGAGVDRPGDKKGFGDKMIGGIMQLVAGKMLADRQREVDMLADSQMRWTAMRPPRLTEGKAKGTWRFDFDRPHATWIDRGDLAGAILAVLEDETMVGKAPFVSAT